MSLAFAAAVLLLVACPGALAQVPTPQSGTSGSAPTDTPAAKPKTADKPAEKKPAKKAVKKAVPKKAAKAAVTRRKPARPKAKT